MKWEEMTDIQQNALIAEKVMGWQWIPFDFDDAYPMKDQLWLLPDALSTHDLRPGEWTWYLEEEQVYPEGKLFPLPHKDKRIVPSWLPYYTKSMDTAWELVELEQFSSIEVTKHWQAGFEPKDHKYSCHIVMKGIRIHSFASTPQAAICLAAIKACGVQVE